MCKGPAARPSFGRSLMRSVRDWKSELECPNGKRDEARCPGVVDGHPGKRGEPSARKIDRYRHGDRVYLVQNRYRFGNRNSGERERKKKNAIFSRKQHAPPLPRVIFFRKPD